MKNLHNRSPSPYLCFVKQKKQTAMKTLEFMKFPKVNVSKSLDTIDHDLIDALREYLRLYVCVNNRWYATSDYDCASDYDLLKFRHIEALLVRKNIISYEKHML